MKLNLLLAIMLSTIILSCSRSSGTPAPPEEGAPFISKEQANRMIKSYLTSIGYPGKDDEIRSWEIDAASLRAYMTDPRIKTLTIIMAHTMDYITSGGEGKRPPIGVIAVTPVIVGLDKVGNPVYTRSLKVMDHASPCPQGCRFKATLE